MGKKKEMPKTLELCTLMDEIMNFNEVAIMACERCNTIESDCISTVLKDNRKKMDKLQVALDAMWRKNDEEAS